MKATYDKLTDIMTLRLLDSGHPVESDESNPGIILDYDESGSVIGIEILDASKRGMHPEAFEFRVNG